MGITEIIKRNGEIIKLNTKEPFCVVKQATQNSSLMGDDTVSLQIVSSKWLSFDKGDKIVVDGFDYTIRTTTTRSIEGDEYYTFEPVFYGPMYDLMKTIYRNCDSEGKSDRSTFDLTYTIKEFVQVVIYNLNRDYPGLWAFDELNCPETEAKTLQFSGVNCLQALQTLCNKDNFNLEFLITQSAGVRTIHIGKFGQRVNPPGGAEYFEHGKGNGLYKLKEQKIDDKAIITRLWVEGGTTNIRTNYRNYSERLQLPYPRRLNRKRHTLFDGTVIEPNTEIIGISDENHRYLEDVALREKLGSEEDTKTYDNIYPTRTGKVTALVDGDIYSFIDDTMDFDLCAKNDKGTIYLVDGVSAKITFTSGRLAGQQFELEAKGGYDHATKKFKLIPFTDNRGLTTPTEPYPNGAYPIEIGATYKITDIFLPESYEQNAEEDLWYAGYNDFKPATQAKAQYSLTLDRLYFLEALSRDSDVCLFKVGDYVPVKDTRFGIEKQIRIQKITRNLLLEQDYQLTLSDTTAINIATQTVLTVIDHEQIIENNRLRDLSKARRGWRTTEDLRNMVYDTDGFFDVDNIRPNSIDTNMLTVGSKSQQFVLTGVILQANVGGNPNRFAASAGILSHLTIDPNRIRAWQMSEATFSLPSNAGYYLFAKCPKNGEHGTWLMTQTQHKFEPTDDPNNYYFLVGILSTLYTDDNFRDFTTTYGFTRINGNTITTGRIVTSDGECYLDLDGNKFRIGDASSSIDWNVSRNNAITLKNVSVVSESGDVSPLGVYRGVWNADYIYYRGDEVSYTDTDGSTCTYRYINATPSKGHKPTDSVYWAILAKGADGADGRNGDSNRLVYCYSFDKPAKPTGTNLTPPGWSDTPDRETVRVTHGNVFSLKDGYYVSPTITDNEITTNRLTLVTTKPNQMVAIELWAQSETNYDFILIGKLDTEGLTRTSNFLDRISGPDTKKVVYVHIPTAGTHFVDVAYAKDSSNAKNGDCGRYRIVAVPNCWLSVGTVAGADAKVVAWTDPIPFSIDTANVERIYRLMTTETTPATPQTDEYVDDFVPPLSTENHVVGKEYKKGDVVIGANGAFYECNVATTTAAPTYKSGNLWVMSLDWSVRKGWTDNPTGVTTDYRYEYESVRKKSNGKWGAFSTPVLWMVLPKDGSKGDKGDDGKPGDFTEYRYAVSGSKTQHGVTFNANSRNPGDSWKTVMPSVGTLQYLWLTTAKINGQTDALIGSWSTPIRVTPYDGVDGKPGAKGDSPALVYRGNYDPNATYYGNSKRVDAVKYNSHYYIRVLNGGTCKGTPPTSADSSGNQVLNGSMWNDFGAEFESIATQLLLAENANIAGWIFRNGRLESEAQTKDGEPMMFLNGTEGQARINGIVQLSCAFSGNISDSNLFWLPKQTSVKNLSMGHEKEDIGKVVRLINSGGIGDAYYNIYCTTFAIKPGLTDATLGSYYVRVMPKECVELTCFRQPPNSGFDIQGSWQITNRFTLEENRHTDALKGRYPRMLAMGRITGSKTGASISGYYYDGRYLSNLLSITRLEQGSYKITFANGVLPDGYKVMCTGYGGNWKGSVLNATQTGFNLYISDDDTLNDGSVEIMIMDDKWWYDYNSI